MYQDTDLASSKTSKTLQHTRLPCKLHKNQQQLNGDLDFCVNYIIIRQQISLFKIVSKQIILIVYFTLGLLVWCYTRYLWSFSSKIEFHWIPCRYTKTTTTNLNIENYLQCKNTVSKAMQETLLVIVRNTCIAFFEYMTIFFICWIKLNKSN